VRRHLAGAQDLAARLRGARLVSAQRRGKFLWLPFVRDANAGSPDAADECLVAHLGMSGQFRVAGPDVPEEKHLHVRFRFADGGPDLRFVDQRTFGGVLIDGMVAAADAPEQSVPASVAHIARDPLDDRFDDDRFSAGLRRKHSPVKRVLLDQRVISGVGNIYADESLWRARLSGERLGASLSAANVRELLRQIREVLQEAVRAGGTSFDALYVNVNGQSGWFERSLSVYGREGLPCRRCGTPIRRVAFANRSSFFCPRCQRRPRPAPQDAARRLRISRRDS
jgi:formamidopyrimidine-DNA glycosylase